MTGFLWLSGSLSSCKGGIPRSQSWVWMPVGIAGGIVVILVRFVNCSYFVCYILSLL